MSYTATAIAVSTALIMIFCRVLSPRIPGPIVGLVLSTLAVVIFKLPVETIGSRFGGIPSGLPHWQIPEFRVDLIHGLLGPAFTVAMLGAIESLMSAVVSDRMSDDRHNPNVELIGQGIANIASPMFGGLPATGAIARTATSIRSGAQSPVAGIIHSLTLLCILLVRCAAGELCAHGRAGGDPHGRRLQHGRVARDSAAAEADENRYQHLAGHFRANRVRRPHGCGRSRHDSRRVAVHQPRGQYNDRFAGY